MSITQCWCIDIGARATVSRLCPQSTIQSLWYGRTVTIIITHPLPLPLLSISAGIAAAAAGAGRGLTVVVEVARLVTVGSSKLAVPAALGARAKVEGAGCRQGVFWEGKRCGHGCLCDLVLEHDGHLILAVGARQCGITRVYCSLESTTKHDLERSTPK